MTRYESQLISIRISRSSLEKVNVVDVVDQLKFMFNNRFNRYFFVLSLRVKRDLYDFIKLWQSASRLFYCIP
jgi:hypothetical protein